LRRTDIFALALYFFRYYASASFAIRQAQTPEDYRGLTRLIYAHVNPYGRFDLNLDNRIDFGKIAARASLQ